MVAHKTARLLPMGDAAWTLELGTQVDLCVNTQCAAVADAVEQLVQRGDLLGVLDVVPTFRSVTVLFDPLKADAQRLGETLLQLACTPNSASVSHTVWRLPVCFDASCGPDLTATARTLNLTEQSLIEQLLVAPLRVFAMGFLPGFAYMAQLPAALKTKRLATPRQRVPAQSLAIADDMACIYPWDSPGGWNLLGCMPLRLFDKRNGGNAALLKAGDEVGLFAISASELAALQRANLSLLDIRAQYARAPAPASLTQQKHGG